MRDVEIVKETRNKLRNAFEELMNVKHAMQDHKDTFEEYDKKVYGYLLQTLEKLDLQINALEFVLNEDTKTKIATDNVHYNNAYGINKEKVMEYMKE